MNEQIKYDVIKNLLLLELAFIITEKYKVSSL